jgi:hypothetical protein
MKFTRPLLVFLILLDVYLGVRIYHARSQPPKNTVVVETKVPVDQPSRVTVQNNEDNHSESLQNQIVADPTSSFVKDTSWLTVNDYKILLQDELGVFLNSLGLQPQSRNQLQNILIDRSISQSAIRQQLNQNAIDGATADDLLARSETYYNSQIKALVNEPLAGKIRTALAVTNELVSVRTDFMPIFRFAGVPLNGEQQLALAVSLRNVYTAPQFSSSSVDEAVQYRLNGIDSSGFSSADRTIIQQAAAHLSDQQLGILKKKIHHTTSQYIKYQTEHK